MRLLNAQTKQLEEFFEDSIPPYAILSHTWGDEEVSFQDLQKPDHTKKLGYGKIEGGCHQALSKALEYIWIDTCCIDKTSSSELQEAINSMFRWYEKARVCYVYLSDVPPGEDHKAMSSSFRRTRWFTRGWTLQELVAPRYLEFYDNSWELICHRALCEDVIQDVTGIPGRFLGQWRAKLHNASIAQRMAWASRRKTTRKEDIAYCLLGIFGINMPLLYGEGKRAFTRLQEEILKESHDQSILAWGYQLPLNGRGGGLFARSPGDFIHCENIVPCKPPPPFKSLHYFMTNKGLRVELPVIDNDSTSSTVLAILGCRDLKDSTRGYIALPLNDLRADLTSDDEFWRSEGSAPAVVSDDVFGKATFKALYIRKHKLEPYESGRIFAMGLRVDYQSPDDSGYFLAEIYPPHWFLILTQNGRSIIRESSERLGPGLRTILLRFTNARCQDIMVLLDYTFQLQRGASLRRKPQALQCYFSSMPLEFCSLADMLAKHRFEDTHSALDWHKSGSEDGLHTKVYISVTKPHEYEWMVQIAFAASRKQKSP